MHIVCPECKFARDIPDAKIPHTAEMATCPKCGHRFRFRSVQQHPMENAPENAPENTPENTPEAEAPPTPRAAPEAVSPARAPAPDEELQPPATAPQDDDAPGPMPAPPQGSPGASANQGDIWDRLEAMGGDEEAGAARRSAPGPNEDPERNDSPPWEDLETYGFFKGFGATVKRAVFGAPAFFRRMPLGRGVIRPMGFYLLVVGILSLVQMVWHNIGMSSADMAALNERPELQQFVRLVNDYSTVYFLVLTPALYLVYLYIDSVITYAFFCLVKANKGGFEGTFRANAYASAAFLFAIIPAPVVAALVAFVWSLIVNVIGFKEINDTSYGKVILALVLKHMSIAAVFVIIIMSIAMMAADMRAVQ